MVFCECGEDNDGVCKGGRGSRGGVIGGGGIMGQDMLEVMGVMR